MNGLEIDLAELETFEKQLADKRKTQPSTSNTQSSNNCPDELDLYLDRLAIDINARNDNDQNHAHSASVSTSSASTVRIDDDNGTSIVTHSDSQSTVDMETSSFDQNKIVVPQASLASLLLGLMSILVFINSVCFDPARSSKKRHHRQASKSLPLHRNDVQLNFRFDCHFHCRL